MENDPLIWQILLQLVLIALNAVFACAEIAVITINDAKLARLAASGDKRAMRLARLTSQPARFLATIQVAITFAGFLGSAFAADNFSDRIVTALTAAGTSIPESTLNTLSVIVITVLLSYLTLVFGELVPKRVAMRKAESVALGLSATVSFISHLFAPIVWLLTVSTNGILRLCGIDPLASDEHVTEEDIRMMIDAGSEKGAIDETEKTMLQNVFEFDDVTADEILTHRTQVDLLFTDETDEEWAEAIHDSRHTRYPVCGDSADDVLGVLDAKNYFRLDDKSRESVMKNAVESAFFVPDSVTANDLFRVMQKKRCYFAIVLDEYGGMSGIVTINDLLEQIVGDIGNDDDEEDERPGVIALGDGSFSMDGATPLDTVGEIFNTAFPDEDFDTLGGLAFSALDVIPDDGSTFETEVAGLSIRVTEIKNHRVERAIVHRFLSPESREAAGGR